MFWTVVMILGLVIGIVVPGRISTDDVEKRKQITVICKIIGFVLILLGGIMKLIH